MKDFEFNLGNKKYKATRANSVVVLFRNAAHQDIDYLQIFNPKKEETTTIYRNVELCRWMAGICFNETGITLTPVYERDFREEYGWYADTIIKDTAEGQEVDGWIECEMDKDLKSDGSWDLGEV